jgi:hypothetical protein
MKINLIKMSLLAGFVMLLNSAPSFAQQDEKVMHGKEQGMKKPPKRPNFSELDLDGDGNISLEEFKQHKVPQPSPEEIFTKIDIDGDGVVSKQEFMDHKPPHPPKES